MDSLSLPDKRLWFQTEMITVLKTSLSNSSNTFPKHSWETQKPHNSGSQLVVLTVSSNSNVFSNQADWQQLVRPPQVQLMPLISSDRQPQSNQSNKERSQWSVWRLQYLFLLELPSTSPSHSSFPHTRRDTCKSERIIMMMSQLLLQLIAKSEAALVIQCPIESTIYKIKSERSAHMVSQVCWSICRYRYCTTVLYCVVLLDVDVDS